jgi:hypothetical protein
LQFSLNVANQSSPPQLVSQTPGVSIALDSSTTPNGGGGTGPTGTVPESVPEPLSLLLWSALAGVGLIRGEALRRGRQRAPK